MMMHHQQELHSKHRRGSHQCHCQRKTSYSEIAIEDCVWTIGLLLTLLEQWQQCASTITTSTIHVTKWKHLFRFWQLRETNRKKRILSDSKFQHSSFFYEIFEVLVEYFFYEISLEYLHIMLILVQHDVSALQKRHSW